MAITATDRELLRETARRLVAAGEMSAIIQRATTIADLSEREVSDVVRVGRHVWTNEEWLAMGLSKLVISAINRGRADAR